MNRRGPLFERLLLRVVGNDVRGRSIAGDLREEYAQRHAGVATRVRYALACLRVAVRYAPARALHGSCPDARRHSLLDLRQSTRALGHAPLYWLGARRRLRLASAQRRRSGPSSTARFCSRCRSPIPIGSSGSAMPASRIRSASRPRRSRTSSICSGARKASTSWPPIARNERSSPARTCPNACRAPSSR